MPNLDENAVMILRVMLEHNFTSGGKEITVSELKSLVALSDDEFQPAYTYLMQSRWISGYGGDDVGKRWMSREGIDSLRREMDGRLRLTVDAERLLRYMVSVYPPGGYRDVDGLTGQEVQAKFNFDRDKYHILVQELEDLGLLEPSSPGINRPVVVKYSSIMPTKEGRKLVRQGFRSTISEQEMDSFSGLFNDVNSLKRTPRPSEIQESLREFEHQHPDPAKAAFIMMRFSTTKLHQEIAETIKQGLAQSGIEGLRADDKEYHSDLFYNILTYVYGCAFGVAVFERIERNDFNPNVSFEVGYMMALDKPVCLLKDRTIETLHADLMGKLYRPFDLQAISVTIPKELTKWLSDKNFGRPTK